MGAVIAEQFKFVHEHTSSNNEAIHDEHSVLPAHFEGFANYEHQKAGQETCARDETRKTKSNTEVI